MAKFLIEVDHEADRVACARAVRVFLATGSHYLTHTDWGCLDGVHTGWIVADVESREQARAILPPAERARARIVALNRFTMEQVEEALGHRGGAAGGGGKE
jgi:hypothetical protein